MAETLFKCGLLHALLESPDPISHASHASVSLENSTATGPPKTGTTGLPLSGLELCCMGASGGGHSRETATGAALAVAEMLLRLFYQHHKGSDSGHTEGKTRKKNKSGGSANNRSDTSHTRGVSGKLRIGDTVIAAGSVSQVCLLSSSLCWSRVSNKDKRRGVVIADNVDGTFLVRLQFQSDCI